MGRLFESRKATRTLLVASAVLILAGTFVAADRRDSERREPGREDVAGEDGSSSTDGGAPGSSTDGGAPGSSTDGGTSGSSTEGTSGSSTDGGTRGPSTDGGTRGSTDGGTPGTTSPKGSTPGTSPTTTTRPPVTTPPTQPPPPPPDGQTYTEGSIAFIGCSNSWMTVEGYHNTPGNLGRLWAPYGTGSKTIRRWAKPDDDIWPSFDRLIAETYGQPKAVWIQLCEDEAAPSRFDDVEDMIANLKTHVTTRVFYISPLNSYSPKLLCPRMGEDGIDDLIQFSDDATAAGLARRGPDVGPLTAATAEEDGCHPNTQGRLVVGGQLKTFIDAL